MTGPGEFSSQPRGDVGRLGTHWTGPSGLSRSAIPLRTAGEKGTPRTNALVALPAPVSGASSRKITGQRPAGRSISAPASAAAAQIAMSVDWTEAGGRVVGALVTGA